MSLRDLGSSWARIRTWLYLTLELGVPLRYNIKFLFSDTKTFWIVPSIQWQPASHINLGILSWSGASHLGFTCLFWAKWRILFLSKENCFLVLKQLFKKKKKNKHFCLFKLKQIQSTMIRFLWMCRQPVRISQKGKMSLGNCQAQNSWEPATRLTTAWSFVRSEH